MWTSLEENALVDTSLEMQDSIWKCDTRYKTGYQTHIEKKMIEKFPYSGWKDKPILNPRLRFSRDK